MSRPSDMPRFFVSWSSVLLLFAGIICIGPFVLLCFYAHPSADDWYMAADTGAKGFWTANVDYYQKTTGRFFSSALIFLHPMQLSFGAFKLYSATLVLALLPCLRWAVGAWFPNASARWRWAVAVSGAVLFLWAMPSTAQGFYWGTGSAGYSVAGLLSLCVAGLLGRGCLEMEWRPSLTRLLGACLLAFCITGCTEVAMALLLLHIVGLNLVFYWRHRRFSRYLILVLAATVAGITVVILSPGNALRSAMYSNEVKHSLVASLLLAVKLGAVRVAGWLVLAPFSLVSLFLWSFRAEEPAVSRQKGWELIGVSLMLMCGTVLGGYFLGTWTMGVAIPQRAVNLVLLFFLMDWMILIVGLGTLFTASGIAPPRLNILATLFVLLALGADVAGGNNNVKTAWGDILSGRARRYDHECTERYELIRSTSALDVAVPPLATRPASIFFNDLKPEPANWRNTGCARFFGKLSITLQP